MTKASLASFLFLLSARAQQREIVGYVMDTAGNPLAGASIVFAARQDPVTDADGRFEVNTDAPAIVVRKPGYRSEFVRLDAANVPRITIQKLKETMVFPTCTDGAHSVGIQGWSARFRFRKVRGIITKGQGGDADFGQRFYRVNTPQGEKGISHGAGPTWSFGDPPAQDVWRLRAYGETVYTVEGVTIIDARGELQDGNRWRFLGMFGETVKYSDVDEATAKLLDRFLDNACLAPRP